MFEFLSNFPGTNGFMPHGHCYLWTTPLLWTYVVSDAAIGLAYFSIPLALIYFFRKRADLHFSWIFILFSIVIFACGTTHFMGVWTIWHPDYWLDASVRAATAIASVITAVLLWPLIPRALHFQSASQRNAALLERNRENEERKHAEQKLAAMNEALEQRVLQRTADLQEAQHRIHEALEKERAARMEAERLNRMKDEFLQTLSHELRTPLNAIFGWTQLLQQPGVDLAMVAKGVDVIDRNVRVQTKLIEDLLDMSAIMSGKIRLDLQPTDLAGAIHSAMASIKPTADAKNIHLDTVIERHTGLIDIDPSRMQQVLWNLLTNAAKFTPNGGKISVRLSQVNSSIHLSITDSGEGISPEFLPNIFERFSQADSSTRRRYGGLGLGLSIVKSLVEMHGGRVEARSDGKGKGAAFIVTLPLIEAMQENEMPNDRRASACDADSLEDLPRLAGVRVLIVDDEHDARELAKTILESKDATTAIAGTADAAYKLIDEFRPDMIICDIGMPREDGYDFIRTIRACNINTPAIALTAFARAEDRVRAIKAGYKAHLTKPVEPVELLAIVASLVGHY